MDSLGTQGNCVRNLISYKLEALSLWMVLPSSVNISFVDNFVVLGFGKLCLISPWIGEDMVDSLNRDIAGGEGWGVDPSTKQGTLSECFEILILEWMA